MIFLARLAPVYDRTVQSAIFPIHEIEAKLVAADPGVIDCTLHAMDERRFSLDLAKCLMDLCSKAESGDALFSSQQVHDDVLVAFRSHGDPAEIFNVRGSTYVQPVTLPTGCGYGPLIESYRQSAYACIADLPAAGRFWLAGHGIGGAFALLAALDLFGRQQNVAAVYTFGAPRLGDKRFVRAFPFPVYRVVNNLDLMVTMPTAWQWRHIGTHVLINADNTLLINPLPWNRLPAMFRQTIWLGEMLADGLASGFPRALYRLFQQVLSDHAPDAYRRKLRSIAQI